MMHFCAVHGRILQPATCALLNGRGTGTPAQPAHWRPIALGVLQTAAWWAGVAGVALPVVLEACDVCARDAREAG